MDLSFKTYSTTLDDPGDIHFIMTMRSEFVRGVLASLKSSMIGLFCTTRPEFVGATATELRNLNAMGVIESQGSRAKQLGTLILNYQRQGGCAYQNGNQSKQ